MENQKWIKVTQQMPPIDDLCDWGGKTTKEVLCATKEGDIWISYFDYRSFTWHSDKQLKSDFNFDRDCLPDFWMLLPKDPSQD